MSLIYIIWQSLMQLELATRPERKIQCKSQSQWFSFYYQLSTIIWVSVNRNLFCSSSYNNQVLYSKIRIKCPETTSNLESTVTINRSISYDDMMGQSSCLTVLLQFTRTFLSNISCLNFLNIWRLVDIFCTIYISKSILKL